jgi:hypothetical protein
MEYQSKKQKLIAPQIIKIIVVMCVTVCACTKEKEYELAQ